MPSVVSANDFATVGVPTSSITAMFECCRSEMICRGGIRFGRVHSVSDSLFQMRNIRFGVVDDVQSVWSGSAGVLAGMVIGLRLVVWLVVMVGFASCVVAR